jgi:formyltetrahydrofolate deformylase
MSRAPDTWILTADCPSLLGTVDAVTRYLFEQGCYVTEHHSFDDRLSARFFIRVEFRQPDGFDEQAFRAGLSERGQQFGMVFELTPPQFRPKVVIMVSKADHCLNDLLYRQRIGQLSMDSNPWPPGTTFHITTSPSTPTTSPRKSARCWT